MKPHWHRLFRRDHGAENAVCRSWVSVNAGPKAESGGGVGLWSFKAFEVWLWACAEGTC